MEKYISREKRDNLHRNLKNVEKFVGVEVCLGFRKGGGCNRFRGDGKKKMRREERRGGEDEFEPTENETRWKSLKLWCSRVTQREDPGKFVGKRRARVWGRARKEHQFLELSLTIRGLSG